MFSINGFEISRMPIRRRGRSPRCLCDQDDRRVAQEAGWGGQGPRATPARPGPVGGLGPLTDVPRAPWLLRVATTVLPLGDQEGSHSLSGARLVSLAHEELEQMAGWGVRGTSTPRGHCQRSQGTRTLRSHLRINPLS